MITQQGQTHFKSSADTEIPISVETTPNQLLGIWVEAAGSIGILSGGNELGVWGACDNGLGVEGESENGTGVTGITSYGTGVHGSGLFSGIGVYGVSDSSTGIFGQSNTSGWGVYGHTKDGVGAEGSSDTATGVYATGGNIGVFAQSDNVGVQIHNTQNGNDVFLSEPSLAGWFQGNIYVNGQINKSATTFKIDHPLDAARKYLSHSAVESPDMKNIYDGVVALDASGEAEVILPSWFEALNTDFRYQLTCIGGYAPVYIAQEVQGNRFKIAGGVSGIKVSWQVTGIRQDAWAKAHPIQVEEDKSAEEHGYYLHPELHGQPEEKHIVHVHHSHPSHISPEPPKQPNSPKLP